MSRRRRRESEAPAPSAGAGLPAFLGERTDSILKIRPEAILIMAVALIAAVILANAFIGPI